MTQATTLYLVFILAGTPTATSICAAWCGADATPGTTAASCHPRTTTHGAPALVADGQECDQLLQVVALVSLQRVASGLTLDHAVVTTVLHRLGWETSDRPWLGTWVRAPSFRPSDSTVLRL